MEGFTDVSSCTRRKKGKTNMNIFETSTKTVYGHGIMFFAVVERMANTNILVETSCLVRCQTNYGGKEEQGRSGRRRYRTAK